jgi:hypothetical protein
MPKDLIVLIIKHATWEAQIRRPRFEASPRKQFERPYLINT